MPWEILILGLAGALGQIVRAGLGLKKAIDAGEDVKWRRFSGSVVYGAISGAAIGLFLGDWRSAFLSGLAATDITESLIHAVKK